jgi:hypothetical protein
VLAPVRLVPSLVCLTPGAARVPSGGIADNVNVLHQEGPPTMSELAGFCVGKGDGNYSHPSDPNKFISCVAETYAYERACPAGYTYDPGSDLCVSPEGSISPEALTHPNRPR